MLILGPSELRAAGVPEPWRFGIGDTVRFGEVDSLGHVNNAAYIRWFETARIRYLMAAGALDLRPEPRVVLRQIECAFEREIGMHAPYVVALRTVALGRSSVTQAYGVFAPDLRATGRSVIVFTQGGRSTPIPEAARAALLAFEAP